MKTDAGKFVGGAFLPMIEVRLVAIDLDGTLLDILGHCKMKNPGKRLSLSVK